MHKFNMLKYGGGAVTLLPQHVAQRMVRHVSKRNGWNGVGRCGEEVQDNIEIELLWDGKKRVFPRGICRFKLIRKNDRSHGKRWNNAKRENSGSCAFIENRWHSISYSWANFYVLRHACGGRNHPLTEVAA